MTIEIPDRIKRLPIDERGYRVPFFVAIVNGKPDHRIGDPRKRLRCLSEQLCWICGGRLGRYLSFNIGSMCVVNRISSEPPAHKECAEYAVRTCPFMSNPEQVRREAGMPEDLVPAPGVFIQRNPHVFVIWTTRKFRPFKVDNGVLFELGEPTSVEWYCEGRLATRAEIMESIDTGLPVLWQAAECDENPAESKLTLQAAIARAMTLVPAAAATIEV